MRQFQTMWKATPKQTNKHSNGNSIVNVVANHGFSSAMFVYQVDQMSYIYNNVWKTFPRKQVPWRNLLQQHHSRSAYALHRCFASVWALDKVENYHGLGSSTCVKTWLKDGRTDLSRNARESWTLAAHGRVHRTFSVATLWKSLALGDVLEQRRL